MISVDQLARSNLEERVRRGCVPDHGQTGVVPVQIRLSDFEPRHPTAKSFIRALLNPDPARCPTAEQALAHTWLTSFAAPTEHDLPGLRENFDPRALAQRDQHGASHVALRHYKGANHHNVTG